MKTILKISICIVLICIILMYPTQITESIKYGINLCLYSVIPSLLPFVFLTNIMIQYDYCTYIAFFIKPILSKLLPVTSYGCFAIISGFLCGYPMGAKVIGDLYNTQKISLNEANYLITFCNNSSLSFLNSYIICTCLQNKYPNINAIILVYTPAILTGLFNAHIMNYTNFNNSRKKYNSTYKITCNKKASCNINCKNETSCNITCNKNTSNQNNNTNNKNTYNKNNNANNYNTYNKNNNANNKNTYNKNNNANNYNATVILKEIIISTLKSLSTLAFYVIIFVTISQFINSFNNFETIRGILSGIIEITSGIYILNTSTISNQLKIYFTFALTILGGFSITFQSFTHLSTQSLKKSYILGKMEQLIIYSILYLII